MSHRTVTDIVRKTDASTVASIFSSTPFHKEDVPVVGSPIIKGKPRRHGTLMHEALADSLEGRWVNRGVWPICSAARGWLRDKGVDGILTEVPVAAAGLRGTCDVLTAGGPCKQGIVEWKTCSSLPDSVPPGVVFQVGLYAHLAKSAKQTWGAIGFICVRKRTIRMFSWDSLGDCAIAAERLAA